MSATAATTKFTDVDDRDEAFSEAVALLAHLNITKGTTETTFGTNENVTRQQMAAFIYRLMKQGKSMEDITYNATSFTDLTDSTYFGYITWAAQTGIIKGISDTEFNPTGVITLQDAYTMLVRALKYDEKKLDLVYPYGFIDIAESEGVELDRNLPSDVDYSTTLTRANVAVLLYNAFFAETGVELEESRIFPYINSQGISDYIVHTKMASPTLAEEVYGVEVGEFTVRATPKYSFNDSITSNKYKPLKGEFDTDMLQLVAVEQDEPVVEMYVEYDKLGLVGKVDDHIMTTVRVFYTYEEENGGNNVNKVYFASNMLKTIETNQAKYAIKSSNKPEDHLAGSDYMEPYGYVEVSGNRIYFCEAPYSYIKPNFSNLTGTEVEKEAQRQALINAKNCKFIDIRRVDATKDTYSYYLTNKKSGTPEDFYLSMPTFFAGGVYKMKFYDVDGDDIYEYIHYMPATFGQMNSDENVLFTNVMTGNAPVIEDIKKPNSPDLDLTYVPTIYYNGATLKGESFFDEEFVIAYLNPLANIIDVYAVVNPYIGYVSQSRYNNGYFFVDGISFYTISSFRVVDNLLTKNIGETKAWCIDPNRFDYRTLNSFNYFPKLIDATGVAVGEQFEIYAYQCGGRNNVLYYRHTGGKKLGFNEDKLIVILPDENNKVGFDYHTETRFSAAHNGDVHYAKVWVDGVIKYVPLDVANMYPKLQFMSSNGCYNLSVKDTKNTSMDIYVGKLATYDVTPDGLYNIQPLLHTTDSDKNYIGIEKTDGSVLNERSGAIMFGVDLQNAARPYLKKQSSTRYRLDNAAGESVLLDDNGKGVEVFELTNNSVIIIKNTIPATAPRTKDEVEFLVYDMNTFGGEFDSQAVGIKNIQVILKNNPETASRADLVAFYAEATNFEFAEKATKDGYRIVSNYSVGVDSEGYYRNFYTLLNPFTGTVDENVPGNVEKTKADSVSNTAYKFKTGDIVEIKEGKVDETSPKYLGDIDTSDPDSGLVWISEYDAKDSFITVVPVAATKNETTIADVRDAVELYTFTSGKHMNYDGKDFITATGKDMLAYEIDEETTVTVLTSKDAGVKAIVEGKYTLGDVSILESAKSEFKCYNSKFVDLSTQEYITKYAPYLKAYVIAKQAKNPADMPIAEHIIIVVNDGDATALLKNK